LKVFNRFGLRTILLIALVLTIASASLALLWQSTNRPEMGQAQNFSLKDLDGNTFSLTDFHGKIVILDFMATWCGPCRVEISHLKVLKEKYDDRIVLVSISIDPASDSEGVLRQFKDEHNLTWLVARDTAGVGQAYGVNVIPTLVIVDGKGRIRFRHEGLIDDLVLSREIDKIS